MSRPTLLLVDDSEAVLAFESAALATHYAIRTAKHGQEALALLRDLRPAAILLDLSMPVMNGEEVLAALQSDSALCEIPVLVVSAEVKRGEACLDKGASAFLAKPIRADALLPLVERLLAQARKARRLHSLACLPLAVGDLEFAVPLSTVAVVVPRPATRSVAGAPDFIDQMFELWGDPVFVLDLAIRFGVAHRVARLEQKLVVLQRSGLKLALCADRVDDPLEFSAEAVVRREQVGGAEHGELRDVLVAVVPSDRGQLPVVSPEALLSSNMLAALADVVRALEPRATQAQAQP